MRDVVATLQAEQDEVVRADREGVLVVQGGPGTGKTVVALHRAAYLLYTYRDRLASAGVLVVGPGAVFMRYVERVLPSLGETAVVLATPGELFPGITASGEEPEHVAALKGDRAMVAVLAGAVRARQRLLDAEVTIRHEGRSLRLDPRVVKTARDNARSSGRLHNPARNVFVRQVLSSLARQAVGRHTWDEYDKRDRDEMLLDLVREPQVRRLLDRLWPHLTAPRLLAELYADPRGAGLTPEQQAVLRRAPGAPWTPADVPLLDEAAELIGEVDPWARRTEREVEARRKRELRYAEDTLRASGAGGGMLDAATLAARYGGVDGVGDLAERALADRTWVFGHVVVDEAQELSWMTWRLLMRRCPSRSMTVVGDVAQAGAPWAARAWSDVLDEHAGGRWRSVELTVGYRTPAQVMAVAADILALMAPELTAPQAVREGEHPPYARHEPDLPAAAARLVAELRAADAGRIGVLVPGHGSSGPAVRAALQRAYPELVGMSTDDPVTVLSVAQSKGLEFDAVIVVDPVEIETGSPHGRNDLYVAVTRTTDRLVVLHPGPLPPVLHRLR
jgi:DNA helicase IV